MNLMFDEFSDECDLKTKENKLQRKRGKQIQAIRKGIVRKGNETVLKIRLLKQRIR